jgi:hypothetical protein
MTDESNAAFLIKIGQVEPEAVKKEPKPATPTKKEEE